ncbi:MAG: SIMPL domain-containing protein [Deltaproteobacteria bacterium]|nr:SIMPL domain-containing protein [Deltaproteobacteria bacterium]
MRTLASLLLGATLVTTACGRGTTAVTCEPAPHPAEPRIGLTVTGTATMQIIPDTADLQMTLTAEAPRPGAAATLVRQRQATIQAQLAQQTSKPEVSLSRLSVEPQYDDKGRIRAYQAAITLTVSTGDFDGVTDLLELGAQAGATQMSTRFRTRDVTGLKAKVRDQALAAVKAKATQTSSGLGVTLGKIVSISEDVGGPWGWGGNTTANVQSYQPAPASSSLSPDATELTLTVTVGYELAPT